MKKSLILAILLVLPGLAEEKKTEKKSVSNLKEAVSSAIENHPTLSAARKAVKAAKSGIDEANGELYPSVDLRSAIGREETENSTVINDGDQHRTLTRFESSLLLRQNLYTGGRISSSIARRKHTASESHYTFLDEKEQTVFNAIDAYMEYSRNRDLVVLATDNVKIHEEILKIVEERKERGMSRDADVIQVKGRLALAKAQYSREIANSKAVAEQFEEAVAAKPAASLATPESMQNKLPEDLKEAKNIALNTHPLLKARQSNIAATKAAVSEAGAAFKPQVALELRAQENDNVGGIYGNDDNYSAMLVVNWNIFRGGSDKAAKISRLFESQQAEDLLFDDKRKIARNTAVAWHDYAGFLVELNYFLQHEKASKETLEAYREQYKLNQRTLFDLLNAQNELFLASSRVIETRYSKLRGAYGIFANMGNLSALFVEVENK